MQKAQEVTDAEHSAIFRLNGRTGRLEVEVAFGGPMAAVSERKR
jgi:hypothetical protein